MVLRMSDSENIIMEIIWEGNSQVSPGDVMNKLPESCCWKYKTVATFLTRLLEKGLLSCEKLGKLNMYTPTLSKDEYIRLETKRFLTQFHQGSVRHLVAALYDDDVDKEKLDKLLALIDKEG